MEIKSTNNKNVLIDSDDAHMISKHKWYVYQMAKGLSYAMTMVNGKRVYMHRFILGAKKGECIDHIDRNGLNNQRYNLRIVSYGVNLANSKSFAHNTSGFRGVVLHRGAYVAQVKHKGKSLLSRGQPNKKTAAIMRDEFARRIWGDNIYLNFPDEIPSDEIKKEASRLLALRDWIVRE